MTKQLQLFCHSEMTEPSTGPLPKFYSPADLWGFIECQLDALRPHYHSDDCWGPSLLQHAKACPETRGSYQTYSRIPAP